MRKQTEKFVDELEKQKTFWKSWRRSSIRHIVRRNNLLSGTLEGVIDEKQPLNCYWSNELTFILVELYERRGFQIELWAAKEESKQEQRERNCCHRSFNCKQKKRTIHRNKEQLVVWILFSAVILSFWITAGKTLNKFKL